MPQQPAPNPLAMLFPFVMMFGIFYLLVFRPQAKVRKDHERMLKGIKKHDEVVTTGGIFGTVVNVKPETVTVRVDENVRLEVEKSAIARLARSHGADAEPVVMEKRG